MYTDSENVKNYHVYQYHHLDFTEAIIDPLEGIVASQEYIDKVKLTINEVKKLFKRNGWEGDGKIGVIWIPPFIDIGVIEDTWGSFLWHVKQSNNGTSFIASPYQLNIKRLSAQNREIELAQYRMQEPINIVQSISERFNEIISSSHLNFNQEYKKLDSERHFESIRKKLLGYTQVELISHFDDYLNGCYLEVLLEVLQNGNKGKIKLRKSSVKIDLSRHNFNNDDNYDEKFDEEESSWMSLQMFIGDIWQSYKFEPFEEKIDKLLKSVDFKLEDSLREFLFKHVIIGIV